MVVVGGWGVQEDPLQYLCLHHGWPLRPQHLDGLEDVHHPFVAHPLQHDTESDEDSGPADPRTAVRTHQQRWT